MLSLILAAALVCPPGYAPGWIDETGQPTSCVNNMPDPSDPNNYPTPAPEVPNAPMPAPTPVPAPVAPPAADPDITDQAATVDNAGSREPSSDGNTRTTPQPPAPTPTIQIVLHNPGKYFDKWGF